jgi:glycosyltransferase involved in cell wall biosynthesis
VSTNLIMFGEDWGAHPSSSQHFARQFATDRKILWVNSIGLRRPRFNRRDLSRLAHKFAAATRKATGSAGRDPPPPGLTVTAPLALPFPGSGIAQWINRELLARQIRPALAGLRIENPILWTALPSAVCAVGALGERAVVYYCGDDFGALPGVDHQAVLAMERRLVARADLVIAASEVLAARFPPERTLLVPHGVDLDRFTTPAPRAPDQPYDRPIAGYYGSISDWIDVELVAKAARDMPDWRFVLIGPIQTDVGALSAHKNVRLLGPLPHDQLPSHIQHWTVALIPFRDTPQIRASDPLKLREYLASGTPIATTPFPALAPFINLVAVGHDRNQFSQTIRAAIADAARAPARRAAVAGQSWHARAKVVAAALERL